MKVRKSAIYALCTLTALLHTGCITTNIHKFRMTASEAPEVHGANTKQEPHSSSWRFTGKINYNAEKNVNITDDIHEEADLDNLFEKSAEFTSAYYEMGGLDFSAKVDYLQKGKNFVVGGGIGYKDGFYSHFTLGANMNHFEFGSFIGLYNQYSELEYRGETCEDDESSNCDTFGSNDQKFISNFFIGAYAGFYFDKLFFNLSTSVYAPDPVVEGFHMDAPNITTTYLTAGYRINRRFEISVSGIWTHIGTSDWRDNVGVTGGVSLYL